MKDIKMIISSEDLRKNRARHLAMDLKRKKEAKKVLIQNILGIALFYAIIVAYIVLVNM